MNTENKIVRGILGRLINEECAKLTECTKRINYLSYQLGNYSMFRRKIKDEVVQDLSDLMLKNGWEDWAKQTKEELIKLEKEGEENESHTA